VQSKTYKDALQPAELDHFAFLLYFGHFLLVFLRNKEHMQIWSDNFQHKQTMTTSTPIQLGLFVFLVSFCYLVVSAALFGFGFFVAWQIFIVSDQIMVRSRLIGNGRARG
jgi:Ca2+/Na+ antiporter